MRLSGWQLPAEYLSASSLTLFMTCAEQYRLRKIKKIPEGAGLSRFIGQVDHATTATNLTRKVTSKVDMPALELAEIFHSEWDNTISEEGEPDWEGSEEEIERDRGLSMAMMYHEYVSPSIIPIKVEQRFEEMIPGIPVPIIGYPDIEESGQIIERKTSATKVNKPKPAWIFQGRIYSLVIGKQVAWHCVTKQKTPQITTPETSPDLLLPRSNNDATVRTLQDAAYLLNETYIRLGPDRPWSTNGTFHPWACDFCAFGRKYANSCVAWNPESPYLKGSG